MKRPHSTDIGFSAEEVLAILNAASRVGDGSLILVGGQAVALWCHVLDVPVQYGLPATVSTDIDFLGGMADARDLHESIGFGKLQFVSMEDISNCCACIVVDGDKHKLIDFLEGIYGAETRHVVKRSVMLSAPSGNKIRVIHPCDLVLAKASNVLGLPRKRTAAGLAQLRLSADILNRYMGGLSAPEKQRAFLSIAEEVGDFCASNEGARIRFMTGINLLDYVPIDVSTSVEFKNTRWPQIVLAANSRYERNLPLFERGGATKIPGISSFETP